MESCVLHSVESVLIIGMSECLVLPAPVICREGVLAPDVEGVLPVELSEDLFSTEHLRLRRPKLLPGPGAWSEYFDNGFIDSDLCFV